MFAASEAPYMPTDPLDPSFDIKGADYGQLFDLEADPGEVRNLWDDPAHGSVRDDLLAVLRDWLIESNYRTRDWMAEER
ncbi:MAG: hypothetical protein EA356_07170 [Geminicoccaceae bacterium]|nr:MAG: hypothetical protein EA356_07170 [Geminicoccaceae bacterium]